MHIGLETNLWNIIFLWPVGWYCGYHTAPLDIRSFLLLLSPNQGGGSVNKNSWIPRFHFSFQECRGEDRDSRTNCFWPYGPTCWYLAILLQNRVQELLPHPVCKLYFISVPIPMLKLKICLWKCLFPQDPFAVTLAFPDSSQNSSQNSASSRELTRVIRVAIDSLTVEFLSMAVDVKHAIGFVYSYLSQQSPQIILICRSWYLA